jgi:3-hydroxybutyrate dehydrogenase
LTPASAAVHNAANLMENSVNPTASLSDTVALVTGAGSGIGRTIARRMAAAGAKVGLLGRKRSALQAVETEITQAGGTGIVAVADVRDRGEVEAAVLRVVGAFGPVTALINNAGSGRSASFDKTSVDLWNDMLGVNLTGAFNVTQIVLPHMREAGRGRIVNVASVAGLKGYPYISAYVAAKHGLVGLTRALAVELAGRNITVNAICPGYVDTPMTQQTLDNIERATGRPRDEARAQLERMSPQTRLFDADEIAAMAVFLCGDDARGVNGQAIPICGGEMAL